MKGTHHMPEAARLQHQITSGFVQIVLEQGGQINAFWAHPVLGGPFPGLVLCHDDRGLDLQMRAVVRRFAEIGYYVIAPDLFDGQRPANAGEAEMLERYYLPSGPVKVDGAIGALKSHHKCNGKLAVIGWDYGGTLAFDTALRQTAIMASVSFYGNPAPYFGRFTEKHCPILGIFGANDEILTRNENRLREELIRTGEPHEVIVYPEAQHGFFNDTLPTYHEEAALDAWNQTLAFLETHQGRPPSPFEPGEFAPGSVY